MNRDDADMIEEMDEHVHQLIERNLAHGMDPRAARRAAWLKFGSLDGLQETCRAARPMAWLADIGRDVWHSLRMIRKDRRFSGVVVVTLALGIGASVGLFSVTDRFLLRPLPYPNADRLVVLAETHLPQSLGGYVRPESYENWRTQAQSFEGIAAVRSRSYNLTGEGDPSFVSGARITANTLPLLGIRPALGRGFFPEEDQVGKGQVVILSHAFWQARFGGDPEVLQRIIRLDGEPFSIVGVMPSDFDLDGPLDLFTPAAYRADLQNRRSLGAHAFVIFGRLKRDVPLATAQQEMLTFVARAAENLSANRGWGVACQAMGEARRGEVRPILVTLFVAVAFLLLIACANVATLLLARATGRANEIAVRLALGAGRARIFRQLLTESLVLALLGGLLGLLAARAAIHLLMIVVPATLFRGLSVAIDARALVFSCLVAITTAVMFGVGPAFFSLGVPVEATLKGSRQVEAGSGRRARDVLVVIEIGAALALLVGAGLLIRSFVKLQQVPRGFEPRNAFSLTLSLPVGKYRTASHMANFAEQATRRLAAIPGVTAVGASQALPFSVDMNLGQFAIAGHSASAAYFFECTSGYLAAMGIPLLRGRRFDEGDRAGATPVAIINESLARAYFGGTNPIGKHIGPPQRTDEGTIVGVVADVKDGRVARPGSAVPMQIYLPLAQNPYDVLTFVLRTNAGAALPSAAMAAAIHDIDGELSLTSLRPLGDGVADSLARDYFAMVVLTVFAGAALLLAGMGVYGVMAYSVVRRTEEIGIRLALGAQRGAIMQMVVQDGARLVAAGVAAGLLGAWWFTRTLQAMLFDMGSQDPLTFAGTVALIVLVAGVACLVPALRAATLEPMAALRHD